MQKIKKQRNRYTEDIIEYDPITGNQTKLIRHRRDGSKLFIKEYHPATSNLIQAIYFYPNGTKYVYIYDSQTGRRTKRTIYNKDNTIRHNQNFN
ncbi:Conserved hypothetical protein [Candidatus Phytoplasma australiense]|uniref:DUF2963 domain-containing protein n=1 Tax=Phytoplasma australiense TaxID=59748 RepID=B1V9W7_PHYAS|nr:Conserved hypothetical protein [Candidatus Phytoplasma australiense]CAM12127.1 Conserved hypothetical protein [Candidatus Phytoplasma australiense]